MPTLHVVIPFYNEGSTFEPCARRVTAAALPEGWTRALIVVDDHSRDQDRRVLDDVATELVAKGHEPLEPVACGLEACGLWLERLG